MNILENYWVFHTSANRFWIKKTCGCNIWNKTQIQRKFESSFNILSEFSQTNKFAKNVTKQLILNNGRENKISTFITGRTIQYFSTITIFSIYPTFRLFV